MMYLRSLSDFEYWQMNAKRCKFPSEFIMSMLLDNLVSHRSTWSHLRLYSIDRVARG